MSERQDKDACEQGHVVWSSVEGIRLILTRVRFSDQAGASSRTRPCVQQRNYYGLMDPWSHGSGARTAMAYAELN